MLKSLFVLGLILLVVGGALFIGVSFPYSSQLKTYLSSSPVNMTYTTLIVAVVGLILIGVSFRVSKMGKYYKFY